MATTTILCLVDVVNALSSGSLEGSLYLMDDNWPTGMPRYAEGTLTTRVRAGDLLIWMDTPMEIETDISMLGIWGIPPEICVPTPVPLAGTDVVYWQGTVQRDFTGVAPYWLDFAVEGVPMRTPATSSLVCGTNDPTGG
jgi:hypothetical protein